MSHKLFLSGTLTLLCFLFFFVMAVAYGETSSDGPVQNKAVTETPVRRVNVPYTDTLDNIPVTEHAILWYGQVGTTSGNFTDIRALYNDEKLFVTFHVYDDLLWYKQQPSPEEMTQWDAVSLYLKIDEGNSISAKSYRLVSQLSPMWESRNAYQAVYVGENGSWSLKPITFETRLGTQMNGINDEELDGGWNTTFRIPFASLGLDGPPGFGTTWRMALVTHDRDGATVTMSGRVHWPESMHDQEPSSWGELRFGMPNYQRPLARLGETLMIREGTNGNHVVDSHAGGSMVCGGDLAPNIREQWGDYNRGGTQGANIQNQWNLWDWPCFSKYYVTFPLDTLPPEKAVISATLTLVQFGNSNAFGEYPEEAQPSLIQVLTVAEDWEEFTLTWNNAPLAVENFSRSWVDPLPLGSETPLPRQWDVSLAVANAYEAGEPLRLALYSADNYYNSGKYFRTSEYYDPEMRPTLRVLWGNPLVPSAYQYVPLLSH